LDVDGDDHVPGLATAAAGLPLAAQADLLPVLDARRDPDGHRAAVRRELDLGTLDGAAEGQGRTRGDVAAPLGGTRRAEAAAAAAAVHALEEVLEDRAAAGGEAGALTTTAEHAVEEVLEAGAAGGAAAACGEAGVAAGHGAQGVVLLALLGVGQDGVRLADLLEAALGGGVTGVAVGVEVTRELAVRLLDGRVVGVLGDAEG